MSSTRNCREIIKYGVSVTNLFEYESWMAASTIFYSSVNSAKEFMRIIIDVDTKLTDISKVMSEDFDVAKTLDEATESADRFGKSISDTLDAYTEFARQGYKGDDLQILANVGLVASNVGELSTEDASGFVTASMAQWNMETSEAMGIIDSWNAISNNYATTVKKLAEGQA